MLRIVECEYPDGSTYGVFFIGSHEIGRADRRDGGWRLWRARKVLPEEQAAKAMLDRAISKAREDEKHARKLLDALRMYCGGSLPPDGSKPVGNAGEGGGSRPSLIGAWKDSGCWCACCDLAANNGLRSKMSVCPGCGDKRCPHAEHHSNQCNHRT
jgi:hypothetical protein